jgi:LacI family transcriptional regulator
MIKVPKILLLLDSIREYERGLLRGIAKYSRIHGPWKFLRKPVYYMQSNSNRLIISQIKQWNPDGIICCEVPELDEILALNCPLVLSPYMKTRLKHYPVIIPDSERIGQMAAEYLISRGFKRFAYCGFDHLPWSRNRGRIFLQTVLKAGFQCDVYRQNKPGDILPWDKEQLTLSQWLGYLEKPVGLMACNDDRCQQVLETCILAQIRIPEEIALIGVNNDEMICELSDPPLSSIALDTETAGYHAAEILAQMISGHETDYESKTIYVSPTHVVERKSTDILMIDDPVVAQAIRFIQKNAKKLIQVREVTEAVSLPRSTLEKRFIKALKKSVFEEITRVRIDLIAQMLTETDMPILQIARTMGYFSAEHISRYFKKLKGMSPQKFRKKYRIKE